MKLKESDLKSCAVVRSAIKQMLGRLRQLKLDVVKVYCDEESSIKKIEEFEWSMFSSREGITDKVIDETSWNIKTLIY